MLKDARERLDRSELVCPITKEAVKDPLVCLVDGFTYEREAITTWIEKNKTSPLTRKSVNIDDLVSPSQLVNELRTTKTRYREKARALNAIKRERDELQEGVMANELKVELTRREVSELKSQLAGEWEAIARLKEENLALKQTVASAVAKNEGIESENAELLSRLSSASRRAKSVQHERDAFNLQLLTAKAKASSLKREVEDQKSLQERLLKEFSSKWALRNKKGEEAAELLTMAIAGRNSRSLLEESTWEGRGETGTDDEDEAVACCGGSGRSGLEEGTWEDGRARPPGGEETTKQVSLYVVSDRSAAPCRSGLEENTWEGTA